MKIKYLLILLPLTFLINCNSEETTDNSTIVEQKNQTSYEDYSEDELFSYTDEIEKNLLDTNKSKDYRMNSTHMLDICQLYVSKFPKSSNKRNVIKKGSKAAQGLNLETEAIRLINISIDEFSNDSTIIEEMNLKAFLYDKIDDKENARIAYQAIIDKFPNHSYSENHKFRLETLDLTDEELIKLFEEKNAK